jgi:bifunctional UDP-N-acetylglucosamine pyrophosphorylase/glucosamine-1-phosphate N-acetyltransferase
VAGRRIASVNDNHDDNHDEERVEAELKRLSDHIDHDAGEMSVILAAGHGKRIKSEKSKMLHEIWGRPSVLRVSDAACNGLSSANQVVVVGRKALEVANALGKRPNRVFVYQSEQRGTGDAVRAALRHPELRTFKGVAYIIPGDMGLITASTLVEMKRKFTDSGCDMLVTTGYHEGSIEENYYGRILKSKNSTDSIIEIKEHRDILAMEPSSVYRVPFRDREERFSREELLAIREFNVGVYAIRIEHLRKLIVQLDANNVQEEIYVTDLIKIFNDNGLGVCSSPISNNDLALSFNVKSVLKKMDATFRDMVYEQLKDIITIDDPEDFFIAEETVNRIVTMDRELPPLDIHMGKGVWIGEHVRLGRGTRVDKNAILSGNLILGDNVRIGENVYLATYPEQTMRIGDGSRIFRGNVIQGNVTIGKSVRIETGVRITGSDEDPVVINDHVIIKGMTYIYGSIIEDNLLIEHSILKRRYVEKVVRKNGEVQPIKYILPHPEGLDSISYLDERKQ